MTKIETKNSPEVLKMKCLIYQNLSSSFKMWFYQNSFMSGEISILLKCNFLAGKWTSIWPGLPDCRASWSQPLPGIKCFSALWPLVWYCSVGHFGFFFLFPAELHLIKIILHFFLKNFHIFVHVYKLACKKASQTLLSYCPFRGSLLWPLLFVILPFPLIMYWDFC